jgi:hypothetical protein
MLLAPRLHLMISLIFLVIKPATCEGQKTALPKARLKTSRTADCDGPGAESVCMVCMVYVCMYQPVLYAKPQPRKTFGR